MGGYLVLRGDGVPGPGVCTWSQRVYLVRGGGGTCPGNPPPVNRMTDRCKNITLPQTSFAGGKNVTWRIQGGGIFCPD